MEEKGELVLNTTNIKKAYLKEQLDKKNPNHVTPEQYLGQAPQPTPHPQVPTTQTTPQPISKQPPQQQITQPKPSGMFKPIE
ncbi:MAG: hypothetical protein LBI53_07035 [Candidatus Peribacteria bacterium]|nr:hypothetical protein [Candidatus Peribacteria bacterium]